MYDQRYRPRRRRMFAAFALSTALFLPVSADAMSLTLEEAINTALAANTGLRITHEGERTADAALKQARGKNSVSVTASDTLRTSKAKDESAQASNGVNLSASLPLYSGGANQASIESGEIGARAARFATERAREELKYEVISAYWNAAEALKKIDVQRDTVNKYDAHLKNVTALYEAGAQAKIDVLRSSVELSNARQELVRAENSYAVSLATLRNLLNIDRTEELTLTTEVAYQPFDTSADNCISYAHRSRLDLIAARAKLRQRELAVESARAGKRPSVNLTLGTGLSSQFQPRHDTSTDVSASVGVSWNIFDSGVTRGAIEEAIERLEQDGVKVNHAHIRLLHPFPVDDVRPLVEKAKRVVVVEQNATGQLASLLKMHVGHADKIASVLKFDGNPFLPGDVYTKCKELLAQWPPLKISAMT